MKRAGIVLILTLELAATGCTTARNNRAIGNTGSGGLIGVDGAADSGGRGTGTGGTAGNGAGGIAGGGGSDGGLRPDAADGPGSGGRADQGDAGSDIRQDAGPTPAVLSANPPSAGYNTVTIGQHADVTIAISNMGEASSGAPAVTIDGTDAPSFSITTNGCMAAVAGGKSCSVTVTFTPTAAGNKSAELTVAATPGGTVQVRLAGTGTTPGAVTITPANQSVAPILRGQSSGPQTFTVVNTGGTATGKLATNLTGSSDFAITADGCNNLMLAPMGSAGASCTITVVFTASSAGPKSATLNVSATPGGSASAALTATALAPAALSISLASFTFASTTVGATSAVQNFTVTNDGDATAATTTVLSAALSGTNTSEFTISANSCTATLAGKASCSVSVAFKPTSAGVKGATLTVSGAPGGSVTAMLGGTGLSQASITLGAASGSSSNFGTVVIGSSQGEAFVVTNTGQSQSSAVLLSLSGADYTIAPVAGACVSGTTTLGPGAICPVHITFAPTATGTRGATLAASAATGGTPPSLNLTGIGKYPTGTMAEFPIGVVTEDGDGLSGIAVGPDNNIWFGHTEEALGRMALGGGPGTFVGTASNGSVDVVAGPDGNMWFTNLASPAVGRTSVTGTTTEFSFAGGTAGFHLIVGPDNNIWFTEFSSNLVLRVSTSGSMVSQYTVTSALELAAGSDGNVWVTGANKVWRIAIASGIVTGFSVGASPNGLVSGPDGNLWIMESGANKIGKFVVSSTTLSAEFTIPSPGTFARFITNGPDGNLWFTESDANKIGRITTAGTITEFTPPTQNSGPQAIVAAPDGNLYFVEQNVNQIGRVTP